MKGEREKKKGINYEEIKEKKKDVTELYGAIPPAVVPPIRTLRGLTHAYTPGEIKSNESTAGIRKMFHRTALCIHALIHKNRSYPD